MKCMSKSQQLVRPTLIRKNGFNILICGTLEKPHAICTPPEEATVEEAMRWIFFLGATRRDVPTP